ncbi:MAG: hypothetical protein RBU23_05025 [Candidatus Auribacterota bacterium]|jgi:hypothetical protein|nr:hypothetical protein [Candidatus Auribacterota bacterium]
MGKQTRFYMTEKDESDLLSFARSDRKMAILPYRHFTKEIEIVDTFPDPNIPFGKSTWLWDMDHSPKPILSFVNKQNYYSVDSLFSEVIEFDRSFFDGTRLRSGRIYIQTGYWDDSGEYVTKSDEFIKWFERLARWIRKNGKRHNNWGYMLPGAQEFAANGGIISSY